MKKMILVCNLILLSMLVSCHTSNLKILKDYSLNFKPNKTQTSNIPKINVNYVYWDSKIQNSLKIDSNKTNIYLTLVLLKLFKAHLICCNQSYYLNKSPFIENFLIVNGFYNSNTVKNLPDDLVRDLIRSDLVYDWFKGGIDFLNNNYVLIKNDKEVLKELKAIDYILK